MYAITNPKAEVVGVDGIVVQPSSTLTPVELTGAQMAHFEAAGCTLAYIADGTIDGLSAELTADEATIAADEATLAGKADKTVTVTGAGLASGGGALSANRTITVTKSSQAQARAGADDSTAMTPARTFDAVKALLADLPTTDPGVLGALWLNAGAVSVSAGA